MLNDSQDVVGISLIRGNKEIKEIKTCNFEACLNKRVSDSLQISFVFYPLFCLLCFPSV